MYKAYEDKRKNNVALSIFKIEISALVFLAQSALNTCVVN